MIGLFQQPKLGLVLGGGGARGGAHIGALKVLQEVGYKPDILVGSSIGGMVAGCIGAGWTPEQIEKAVCEMGMTVVDCSRHDGFGATRSKRLEHALQEMFGDADLRDLTPKIAVMATDLRGRQRVLLKQGPA